MPYIIDGHNLIGKLPGLRLDDHDDERALIEILQGFCQRTGKDVTVYFDKAQAGGSPAKVFGRLTARFVRAERTADQAIAAHLKRLGKQGPNWVVVSSDHEVINAAKRVRARTIPSEEFARELSGSLPDKEDGESPQLSGAEVDEWLDLFGDSQPD